MTLCTLRRRLASPLPAILVGLALVGFILGASSIPHSHHPDRPGVYNQEHDLGYLATFGSVAAMPVAPSAAPIVLVVVLAVTAVQAVASAPWRRHADFRAPPQR